jgi:hypothetical protein
MTIDEAIKLLESEKAAGVKSIIAAWWSADMFSRNDDEEWQGDAEFIEQKMDWASTHEDLQYMLNSIDRTLE